VFAGFVIELFHAYSRLAGVYCSQNQWNSIMGSGYGIPPGTPVWSFDGIPNNACSGNLCPIGLPSLPQIGGISPTIWQYAQNCPSDPQDPTKQSDYDVATSLPS